MTISWEDVPGGRSRPLQFSGRPGGWFTPVSPSSSGVTAATAIGREAMLANRTMSHGNGVALGDADGDGWVDLYFPRIDGSNVLYRNLGGWRFEDVSEASGTRLDGRASRGAVFADADGDGDLDLFVTVHGAPNVLLRNDGTGVFAEADAGFEGSFGTTTLALADIDADGDLDAYFANYKTIQADDLFSPAERTSRRIVEEVDGEYRVRAAYREHYEVERVGDRMRRWELADPDEFYLNDGSGRFVPDARAGGVFRDEEGRPLAETSRAWGLVARFFDMDDDLDPDLYVANDFGSPDAIWRNDGGRFGPFPELAIRTTSASSMGIDFADVDRDGDTDFVTTDMLALDPVRRRLQGPSVVTPPAMPGRAAGRSFAGRNVLQLNRGDGTFAEVGRLAGLAASEWTWGALFLDADLDGYEDLFVTNGHVFDPLDGDTQEALRTGRIAVDWQRELGAFPSLELENLAFRNRGDGTFDEVSDEWGYGAGRDISHGIATGDLDRDGDLDIVITRLDRAPLLLRNDAGASRLSVRLIGVGPNVQAIGARVTVVGDGMVTQTRQLASGGMYLSGADPLLAFAVPEGVEAQLRIVWPSGVRSLHDVRANRLYEVREPTGTGATAFPDRRAASPLLFETVASDARHAETPFDELARQPLLPFALSRLGPGISWLDVDRDGDPDLLTTGAAGGTAILARVDRGRLTAATAFGPPVAGEQTTLLGTIGPRGETVIAGVSNWRGMSPDALADVAPVIDLGASGAALLPGDFNSTGPLAQADVDGDGDLDVFVGGRALPGAYPLPSSSKLLLGGPSGWTLSDETETFRSVGLVSAVVFSDVDLDGDPDLLLALEWGPVRLFINENGEFSDATADWGLSERTGRWNGLATGDLDEDGRPDLVVTSWGHNLDNPVTPDRPAVGFAADFDGNGQVDFIEARRDGEGRAVPVRDYRTLSAALPFIRRVAPTFEAFATASVEDLVEGRTDVVYEVTAVTSAHTAFLNRGDRFEAVELPRAAQRAPAFGVVIADFDRDGHEDVYLAQNFMATAPGIGRHDAGRGAFLFGDGLGHFRYSDAGTVGAPAYGDARGAAVADFDADGRWDLAVGQNGCL
ncbi:MAG: VCBS repeat-containing protein, partial [Gemmatimonadota bacterium]